MKQVKDNPLPQTGDYVRVYRDLTKKCYSIQQKLNGSWKVVGHADSVNLRNAKFSIGEKTRQRVVAEKKKYVHAYVYGNLIDTVSVNCNRPVYYNPFKTTHFIDLGVGAYFLEEGYALDGWREEGIPKHLNVSYSSYARMTPNGVFITPRPLILFDFKHNKYEEYDYYSLAWDMRDQFAGMLHHLGVDSNSDFESLMVAQGILNPEHQDSEFSYFYGNWPNLLEVAQFVVRFNNWIKTL